MGSVVGETLWAVGGATAEVGAELVLPAGVGVADGEGGVEEWITTVLALTVDAGPAPEPEVVVAVAPVVVVVVVVFVVPVPDVVVPVAVVS